MSDGGMKIHGFACIGLAALLAGCNVPGDRHSIDVEQCENRTKLRVKVGDALFDFPNRITIGGNKEARMRGIFSIDRLMERPTDLLYCNIKSKPVADFGDQLNFVYRGDGVEPQEYRGGNAIEMHAITHVSRYRPATPSQAESGYLADVSDIENVRYVAKFDIPPTANYTMGRAKYEFAYKDRKVTIVCQMWDDSKTDTNYDNPRPAYPFLCTPKMPFRAGNLLICVDQVSHRGGFPGALIPPEEWPRQWAYSIERVLRYRVK
jgi:hypothetical protein